MEVDFFRCMNKTDFEKKNQHSPGCVYYMSEITFNCHDLLPKGAFLSNEEWARI